MEHNVNGIQPAILVLIMFAHLLLKHLHKINNALIILAIIHVQQQKMEDVYKEPSALMQQLKMHVQQILI